MNVKYDSYIFCPHFNAELTKYLHICAQSYLRNDVCLQNIRQLNRWHN